MASHPLRHLTYCGLFPRYIDQGRNPQLYTKECLERALAKNEQVKGKIDTMKVSLQVFFSKALYKLSAS